MQRRQTIVIQDAKSDMNNKSITFSEATKSSRKSFTTLVKPVGSSCNLACHYCYYTDKAALYGGSTPCMSLSLLETYIKQFCRSIDVPEITFCWHGGEPLLAGIDFYKHALRLQRRYAGGRKVVNTIQTNGTLVDDEWCRLFADNDFLVGLSLDGPEDIHDGARRNKAGAPTFARVMRAVELFARHGVEFNTLSVVSRLSEGRGVETYDFLRAAGSRYMQFLPAVEYLSAEGRIVSPFDAGGSPAPWSVSPEGFGRFMTDIFDRWVTHDVGSYFVQLFDVALAQWVGVNPGLCSFSKSCGDGLAVEHNGDVYACDHFVYPEYRLGNITEGHLSDMYVSRDQFLFGMSKRSGLAEECTRCRYYFACTGGCPKHRFGGDSEHHGKNALCRGYYLFFDHVAPYMARMADLLRSGREASRVMEWARGRINGD